MQWYFVTCGPTDIGVVGFRPSGVRTAFEQQTGELSNALSLYFTDARCVWRHGFISCHAIWEDVESHHLRSFLNHFEFKFDFDQQFS